MKDRSTPTKPSDNLNIMRFTLLKVHFIREVLESANHYGFGIRPYSQSGLPLTGIGECIRNRFFNR
jgi:hypothetical protein